MGALEVLSQALHDGARVVWDPDRPKLILPRSVRDRLEQDRHLIREILRRASVFRELAAQFIEDGRALPVLALPGVLPVQGTCISCSGDLAGGRYRCPVCTLAVTIALETKRRY